MSLEHKLKTEEKGLLRRFLNSAKSKLNKAVLGASLAATSVLGCDGGHSNPPAPVNNAPNFTSTPVTSVWEGNAYNYDADAVDPEGDNPVTYSLVSGPSWASIDTNGIVSGTPTGYSANTLEGFTVRATDSKGNRRNQNFNVNVTNLGTVSGNVVDIDNNGLVSKTVDLWNSTYAKGRFTATTDGSGNFTIADTVAGGNNVPNLSDWNYEIGDGYTGIFKFLRPNEITSGDTHVMTQPQMILMHSISSTNSAYQDSLGNASFLALFKEMTRTRPGDSTQLTKRWGSYPVDVDLNASAAPANYVTWLTTSISRVNTAAGIQIFNVTGSSPTNNRVRFIYPASISGGLSALTSYPSFNGNGTFDQVDVQVVTGLSQANVEGVGEHELAAHCVDNGLNQHTADGIIYIRAATGTNPTHADEGRVLKYNAKLPNRTNMNDYIDQ